MALMSHPSSSHCIHSEIIQCKSRHNGVNSFANTMESTKNKDIVFGLRPPSRSSMKLTQSWSLDGTEMRQGRGHLVTVAASPPTEDAVIASEPLTKEDLVGYLASGCKPKEKWRLKLLALVGIFVLDFNCIFSCKKILRIGTEHEKFGFEIGTLKPMKYEQIAELLNGISERFDWDKIMEGEYIIGLKQGKQSISLEPGGQFELSGAPLETLHQTCAEVNSHLYQVKAVAKRWGLDFWELDFSPNGDGRYEIMRNYMPKVGSLGLDMMFRTCTVQVNLDFHSEADMIRKFRAGLALQPIATALFANSPFTEGKPNGYLSMRSQIWTDTDNNRAGMLPFVFDDSFGALQPPSPPTLSKLLITSNSSSIYSSSTSGSNSRSLIRSVSLFLHNKLFEPKNSIKSPDLIEIHTIMPLHHQWLSSFPLRGSMCKESASLSLPCSSLPIRYTRRSEESSPMISYISNQNMESLQQQCTGTLIYAIQRASGIPISGRPLFEQYVDYALDVPMYFVYRNKKYIDCAGMSFRDFLAGKLPNLPGDYPTLNDWENHLTTIFPEVRLKRYLEMRGADGGPWRRLCALPAFWSFEFLKVISFRIVFSSASAAGTFLLYVCVPKSGLKTPFRDGLLKHVAQEVVKFAKDGLERRGFKETGFLNEVTEVVNTGVTPAEKLLELYHGKWGQTVDPVFEELLY
ncbi:hypothetical protein DH2020_005569 [Rehmannia glutinosa]|uniref:glutamate--cysteine ligase n=1 Tax=Rehmannia glutinosa TaxID=99300 RepID=A0ABR0XGI3_REHGL